MFGIKTKKDKKIEELQNEIDRLKTMLIPTTFTYQNADVITWVTDYSVPFNALDAIPKENIKRVLANKMLEVVEENLEVESTEDVYRGLKIFRAKLRVVKKVR